MMLVPEKSFSINAVPLGSEHTSRIVMPLHSFVADHVADGNSLRLVENLR